MKKGLQLSCVVFFSYGTALLAQPVQPTLRCWGGFNPAETVKYIPGYGGAQRKEERTSFCVSVPPTEGSGEAALSEIRISTYEKSPGRWEGIAVLYFQIREWIRESWYDSFHHLWVYHSQYVRESEQQCPLRREANSKNAVETAMRDELLGSLRFLQLRVCRNR